MDVLRTASSARTSFTHPQTNTSLLIVWKSFDILSYRLLPRSEKEKEGSSKDKKIKRSGRVLTVQLFSNALPALVNLLGVQARQGEAVWIVNVLFYRVVNILSQFNQLINSSNGGFLKKIFFFCGNERTRERVYIYVLEYHVITRSQRKIFFLIGYV